MLNIWFVTIHVPSFFQKKNIETGSHPNPVSSSLSISRSHPLFRWEQIDTDALFLAQMHNVCSINLYYIWPVLGIHHPLSVCLHFQRKKSWKMWRNTKMPRCCCTRCWPAGFRSSVFGKSRGKAKKSMTKMVLDKGLLVCISDTLS